MWPSNQFSKSARRSSTTPFQYANVRRSFYPIFSVRATRDLTISKNSTNASSIRPSDVVFGPRYE